MFEELYSTHKLGNPNTEFYTWKEKIEFVFALLEIDYVLTKPKPADPIETSSEESKKHFNKWIADDQRCQDIIVCATAEEAYTFFDSYPTAKEMIDAMKKHFTSTSVAQRMILVKKYTQYKMVEGTKIVNHTIQLDMMVNALKDVGIRVPEEMQVVVLINSMPESWKKTVDMCLSSCLPDNQLSLDRLISSLKVEERQREFDASKMENVGKGRSKAVRVR